MWPSPILGVLFSDSLSYLAALANELLQEENSLTRASGSTTKMSRSLATRTASLQMDTP